MGCVGVLTGKLPKLEAAPWRSKLRQGWYLLAVGMPCCLEASTCFKEKYLRILFMCTISWLRPTTPPSFAKTSSASTTHGCRDCLQDFQQILPCNWLLASDLSSVLCTARRTTGIARYVLVGRGERVCNRALASQPYRQGVVQLSHAYHDYLTAHFVLRRLFSLQDHVRWQMADRLMFA